MAGGFGRRMGMDVSKPLLFFRNKPLIRWIIDAAAGCKYIDYIYAALTPKTMDIQNNLDVDCVITEGKGYVEDMMAAVEKLSLGKTFVLSADLPLITSSDLNWVAEEYERQTKPALSVYVPLHLSRGLGLTPSIVTEGLVPSGVNIVDSRNLDGEEVQLITENPSFAFNINTQDDLKAALVFFQRELLKD